MRLFLAAIIVASGCYASHGRDQGDAALLEGGARDALDAPLDAALTRVEPPFSVVETGLAFCPGLRLRLRSISGPMVAAYSYS